jgi:asparagine synthase (glutamine-hydrolysing)
LADLGAAHGTTQVECLTLALPGAADESAAAASTARALGLRHASVACGADDVGALLRTAARAYDEPQTFGALLTASAVAEAARKRGKVVLSGDGGDEAFAGYAWHHGPFDSPMAHLGRVMPRFMVEEANELIPGAMLVSDDIAAWAASHDAPGLPDPRRAQRFDLLTFCAGSILPKIDRAAMHVGLEVRAPLLDRRILAWALSRPVAAGPTQPVNAKAVLRRYLEGRVPSDVLARPKQGFSLRLGDADPWPLMLPQLGETRLARDVLSDQWRTIIEVPGAMRSQRMFSLLMLAAWFEERA